MNNRTIEVELTDPKYNRYKQLSLGGHFVGVRKQGDKFKLTQSQVDDAKKRGIGITVLSEKPAKPPEKPPTMEEK